MSTVKTAFSNARNTISNKMMGIIPTSRASKIAKMMVLMLTFAVVVPMQVQAADFITEAIGMLGIVIIAIGGGLGIWGIVNLLEGYGNDNPGAKSQGIKQLMAGGGLILIGIFVPDALSGLF